jgi:ABC-type sugar transport system ATPase subunit
VPQVANVFHNLSVNLMVSARHVDQRIAQMLDLLRAQTRLSQRPALSSGAPATGVARADNRTAN